MERIHIINMCHGSQASKLDLSEAHFVHVKSPEDDLCNKRIVIIAKADKFGNAPKLYEFLSAVRPDGFNGAVGALIVESDNDLHSKTLAAKIVFDLNQMGMTFIGRPLVEVTQSKKNFRHSQKDKSFDEAFLLECKKLFTRLLIHSSIPKKGYKLLVLHASGNNSNTLMLWNMVKEQLENCEINEIQIENGAVHDCIGCSFKVCSHYGERSSCFYGGVITDEVFPAILSADKIVLLCPNYNDALTANISAMINRLTSLYRHNNFYDKAVYAVIVSGYSGSDALAKQLICALNMNKAFMLPPNFALMEIANDKGEINTVSNINERARDFARRIDN